MIVLCYGMLCCDVLPTHSQVQSSDGVLELGCSYGCASRMLQEHAGWLAAVDNSAEVLAEVCMHVCDALRITR